VIDFKNTGENTKLVIMCLE